jgi:hypothetical protein
MKWKRRYGDEWEPRSQVQQQLVFSRTLRVTAVEQATRQFPPHPNALPETGGGRVAPQWWPNWSLAPTIAVCRPKEPRVAPSLAVSGQ